MSRLAIMPATLVGVLALAACRGDIPAKPGTGCPTIACPQGQGCMAGECVPRMAGEGVFYVSLEPPAGPGWAATELVDVSFDVAASKPKPPLTEDGALVIEPLISVEGSVGDTNDEGVGQGGIVVDIPSTIVGQPARRFEADYRGGGVGQGPAPFLLRIPESMIRCGECPPRQLPVAVTPRSPADRLIPPTRVSVAFCACSDAGVATPLGEVAVRIPPPASLARLGGTLVDAEGKKLDGWRVRAFAAGDTPRPGVPPPVGKVVSSTDVTDEGGAFSLALAPDSAPGEKESTVYMELTSPEGARPELLVRVGPRDVPDLQGLSVALPPIPALSTFTIPTTGPPPATLPAGDVSLRLRTQLGGTQTSSLARVFHFAQATTSRVNGEAEVDLLPGFYDIVATPSPDSPWAPRCIPDTVVGGGGGILSAIQLPNAGRWDASLGRDGSLLPVGRVVLAATPLWSAPSVCWDGQAALSPPPSATLTAPEGTFGMNLAVCLHGAEKPEQSCAPIDYRLEAIPPFGAPLPRWQTTLQVGKPGPGQPDPPAFFPAPRLPAGALAEGRVRTRAGKPAPGVLVRVFKPTVVADPANPGGMLPSSELAGEGLTDETGAFQVVLPKP